MMVESKSEDCLLCGKEQPSGHVVVMDESGKRKGRICSNHTLLEVIQDPQDCFMVEVKHQDA